MMTVIKMVRTDRRKKRKEQQTHIYTYICTNTVDDACSLYKKHLDQLNLTNNVLQSGQKFGTIKVGDIVSMYVCLYILFFSFNYSFCYKYYVIDTSAR